MRDLEKEENLSEEANYYLLIKRLFKMNRFDFDLILKCTTNICTLLLKSFCQSDFCLKKREIDTFIH